MQYQNYSVKYLDYSSYKKSLCFICPAEPVCANENILNFTQSGSVTTSADTACLVCLFNGVSPLPGTMWFVNGQLVDSMEQFAQVNANGTLVIRRPPGFTGEVVFSCQSFLGIYNITLIGELNFSH